jgi:uncharacterized protein
MAEERGQNENLERQNQDGRSSSSLSNQGGSPEMENMGMESSGRKGTSNRGFAAMDPERQKRIASEGGRAAHKQGVAHEWSKDEAREAGRKGGQIVSQNREHMSEIGRKGGQSSGSKRGQSNEERS